MEFQGAVIKERGVTFAIVVVRESVIDDKEKTKAAMAQFQPMFPGVPVVLMAQNSLGTPIYVGRQDLVSFLQGVPLKAIPWKKYRLGPAPSS